jgi:hypothetical protein
LLRADLSYALLFGLRPRLFREGIQWDSFTADRGLIQCTHQTHDAFTETTIDGRLHNILRELHAFSCISNLAYQTTRKFSPDIYNEMMISILYRLTHLSFKSNSLHEAIRTGLLAFSSTIFIQRHFMKQPYDNLLNLYTNAVLQICEYTDSDVSVPIALWLAMLSHVIEHTELSPADWRSVWLDKVVLRAGIDLWSPARELLRSKAWVDFIHDRIGKQVFEAAILRLENVARLDI